ncbi:MAG: hypothetical protein ABW172_18745, partial [Candidatus Binatia bacterium]
MNKALLYVFLFLLGMVAQVSAQTPYYQGKTIAMITGSQAGDLFDLYARMVAMHMAKHIPGNPST